MRADAMPHVCSQLFLQLSCNPTAALARSSWISRERFGAMDLSWHSRCSLFDPKYKPTPSKASGPEPTTSLSGNHAAIQLPWKPSVTRCDSSASAIGPSASIMASKMARSLRFSVAL